MLPNLERYKKDLDSLIAKGGQLENALQAECLPEGFKQTVEKQLGDKADHVLKSLPSFSSDYQSWYSEAKVLVRQLLPDQISDFIRHYEKPKTRKEIT